MHHMQGGNNNNREGAGAALDGYIEQVGRVNSAIIQARENEDEDDGSFQLND